MVSNSRKKIQLTYNQYIILSEAIDLYSPIDEGYTIHEDGSVTNYYSDETIIYNTVKSNLIANREYFILANYKERSFIVNALHIREVFYVVNGTSDELRNICKLIDYFDEISFDNQICNEEELELLTVNN